MSHKKILIWEVNWIGDVLFTTPFIRSIRERFPDAHLTCICAPRCREILEVNPNINEVIVYDEKTINKGLVCKLGLIARLKREKYDMVFLLHRSLTRTLICFLSGIRQRIGYVYKKRNFLLTIKAKHGGDDLHRIEYYLGLARRIGADTTNKCMEFYLSQGDREYADNFFRVNKVSRNDKVVAINPGGNWDKKRWPAEKFAALCQMLIKDLGVTVLITGAEKDIDLYLKIQDIVDNRMLACCGKTTLRQLGAVFSRCDVVVSGDSGPMHVALALKRKVVALFGPTSPAITGPYGEGKYITLQKNVGCKTPCYNAKCADIRCMCAISPEDAFAAVKRLMSVDK